MTPHRRRHRTSRRSTTMAGPADCWVYEDLVYIHKRHVAAVGFTRDEMTLTPITYDEMRPGCYDPRPGCRTCWPTTSTCRCRFPTVPAVLRADLHRGHGPRARRRPACTPTTTGWSRSGAATPTGISCRCASSRCGTPSWPPPRCAATPPAACHAVCFSEIPPHLGLPSIHTGYWDPFFAACDGHRRRWCACTSARRRGCRPPSPDAPVGRAAATLSFDNSMAQPVGLPVLGRAGALPRADAWPTARARSAGCPTSSSGPTTCGASTVPGAAWPSTIPEPPSTYYYRQVYGCFFRDQHGLDSLDAGRRRQHHLRDRLPPHRHDLAAHQGGAPRR